MRWMRVVAGGVLVGAAAVVVLGSASALAAGHWLLPVLLGLAVLLGVGLLVTGLRTSSPPRPGAVRTVLRAAGLLGAVGAAAALVWLEPLVATDRALGALASDPDVVVTTSRTSTTFMPTSPDHGAGLVLYPGARVDPLAYAVLAHAIAAEGHPVVVLSCPLNLALLCGDPGPGDAAGEAPAWAVGGHSLGGVEAAAVAEGADGLVLWAAYPSHDMSASRVPTASITASQDGLATPAKVADAAPRLPQGTVSTVVEGAIHSFFGDYGDQPGDGTPTVSREVAQQQIVTATVAALDALPAQP